MSMFMCVYVDIVQWVSEGKKMGGVATQKRKKCIFKKRPVYKCIGTVNMILWDQKQINKIFCMDK